MIGVHNDLKMHLYVFISVCEYIILVVQLHLNEVEFYR